MRRPPSLAIDDGSGGARRTHPGVGRHRLSQVAGGGLARDPKPVSRSPTPDRHHERSGVAERLARLALDPNRIGVWHPMASINARRNWRMKLLGRDATQHAINIGLMDEICGTLPDHYFCRPTGLRDRRRYVLDSLSGAAYHALMEN